MNTLYFRYAVEIEKTHSITQAAENLYMAQPNLSKAIKELENTLGITIFRRTSKGVLPTEQGMKFLEYAKQVLIQIAKMEAIHAPGKEQERKLRVSAPRTGYISHAFSQYVADMGGREEMEIYFCETNSVSTVENVREKGYDFGIIRYNAFYERYVEDYLAEKNLVSDILWEFEMIAIMAAEHPAAKAENLAYSELSAKFTELCYADDTVPNVSGLAEKVFTGNRPDVELTKRVYLYDRGTVLAFLQSDAGAFILDSPAAPRIFREHGLIQRRCSFPENHFRDAIIYAEGHRLADKDISLLNKIYEVRNEAAFTEFR